MKDLFVWLLLMLLVVATWQCWEADQEHEQLETFLEELKEKNP